MQCLSCRNEIAAASRFCPSCGAPTGSDAATFAVPPRERPPSTDPLDGARFIPGAMLAGRYRIVGLLGRGGMGEVYRAEDLKLGQPVALKFLPEDVAKTPDRLARFHHEVRVARQVSHPNVCRVYDIGEADGQHFISMEYVDGEDLASLLRRIGRLPSDKATELARQLCAGLAAAHDRGVLHRDLKPANVLIDGRGRARIADFGLAGLIDDRRDPHIIAGTPGYMAPEQLVGQGTSARTDVYALGLVLYEMFTGKRALTTVGANAFTRGEASGVAHPSTLIPDLDQAIERVILRCLEPDPARRPASALVVAAALPGGDPLAAALAAGETPSPEMVAAAGSEGSLSPAKGLACLAAIVLGLVPLGLMARYATLPGLANLSKSPAALAERARTIARNLGYTERPAEEAYGYATNADHFRHLQEDRSMTPLDALKTGQPAAFFFWYRQSPRPFVYTDSARLADTVSVLDPPDTVPGMLSIRTDPSGRLVALTAVPPQLEMAHVARTPDWKLLFTESGLPFGQFSPRAPSWRPPVYADERAAWDGTFPDRPDIPVHVEAAAADGKPVYFEIATPWTRARLRPPGPSTQPVRRFFFGLFLTVLASVLAGLILLARWNFRFGRGDRSGAFRLAVFVLVVNLLTSRFTFGLAGFLALVALLPTAVFGAATAFVAYIAIEPHIRRVWPETMIGWCRLLAGRLRDPLIGRDLLFGTLAGIIMSCTISLWLVIPIWAGLPPRVLPFVVDEFMSGLLLGGADGLIQIASTTLPSFVFGLVPLFVLFVFTRLFRSRRIAAVGVVVLMTAVSPATRVAANPIFAVIGFGLGSAGMVFMLVRFGLLPAIVATFVFFLTTTIPITIDSSSPNVGSSYLIIGTIVALAAYGFHTALAGRPIFSANLLGDEPGKA